MSLYVRDANPDDAPAITAILEEVVAHGGLTALTRQTIAPAVTDKIENYVQTGTFKVACTPDVVGFQYLSPYTGLSAHVADIATFANITTRQSGIGRTLFEATKKSARQKGFRKITARIRGDNHNGLPFYAAMGFREVGIYRDHSLIDGNYVDQVLMEYLL